ncbi:hydantoinase B/oxoprolinase family protein [Chloroflexota bacterium]
MGSNELDPVKYEIFVGRLRSILEEGRLAVLMVCGSPAVAEGGECMTSIYDGDGKAILTASGTLFHVTGSADAIKKTIEWDSEDPGINDGDQFLFGDAYIAGTHSMDQIMVKPVFYQGERVGWVGTMTHTGDIGGVFRGISLDIFHEGIRIRGLKLVERHKLRRDLLRVLTEQCRDPDYVGLDMMARIAANNVCSAGYLALIEKFGVDFVKAASQKLMDDTKRLVRDKLRRLVDGTYRQPVYAPRVRRVDGKEEIYVCKIMCTMTKKGDQLTFDASGSSPQNYDYFNATFPAAKSNLFIALAGFLFWDIPWNAGLIEQVNVIIPEGTMLNCRFPASCGLGTGVGAFFSSAAMGCIERMLFVSGEREYINSAWGGGGVTGAGNAGPAWWYAGHNQHGGIIGSATYDLFAAGQGATPFRDGNDTGGFSANAKSCISDAEWAETYFPFLFLSRRQGTDSGGYGKFRGGLNLECIQMVYGSEDLSVDYIPASEGGEVSSWGLFGGYPVGNILAENRLLLSNENIMQEMYQKRMYPTTIDELDAPWGVNAKRSSDFHFERNLGGIRIDVGKHDIVGHSYGYGGGYGDPIERDPLAVVKDVKNEACSLEVALKVYGVVFNPERFEVDYEATRKRREEIKQERLSKGVRLTPEERTGKVEPSARKRSVMMITEYVEIIEKENGDKVISCIKCGYEFCSLKDNYKKYALRWTREPQELKKVLKGEPILTYYQEYICPGCGTLLQVDLWWPLVDTDEPLWDIQVEV